MPEPDKCDAVNLVRARPLDDQSGSRRHDTLAKRIRAGALTVGRQHAGAYEVRGKAAVALARSLAHRASPKAVRTLYKALEAVKVVGQREIHDPETGLTRVEAVYAPDWEPRIKASTALLRTAGLVAEQQTETARPLAHVDDASLEGQIAALLARRDGHEAL